jgi:hypothetical protein
MIKSIIFVQTFGCGDILFSMSLAHDFTEQGYRVIWPVDPVYASLAKHFPDIAIVDKSLIDIDYKRKQEYEINGTRIIPLRYTDSICKVPYSMCMKSKYMYFKKDWTTWKDKFGCIRDEKAEDKLYYDVLKLKDGEPYNLISEQFSRGGRKQNKIKVDNGLKNVYMTLQPEFTIIDWLKVLSNATYMHVVSSANIYLFELFKMNAKEIHLYIRRPVEKSHENYSYLLTDKNNYILEP